jgi:hypothetical protein
VIDLTNPALDAFIALAVYGVFIQRWALAISWRQMHTANVFAGRDGMQIGAIKGVVLNIARMIAVVFGLLMSLFFAFYAAPKTISAPAQSTIDGDLLSGYVLFQEIYLTGAATLEVVAHKRLVRAMRRRLRG